MNEQKARAVLLLDSGIGGLTVARAIRSRLPGLTQHYMADRAAFPYGGLASGALIARVCDLITHAVAACPVDAVVIACNTASTVVLPALRARLSIPVVGVVPAIRPAAAASCSGVIGVLATPGTVKSAHVATLIERFAGHCRVLTIGAPNLAALAEQYWLMQTLDENALNDELSALRDPEWRALDRLVLGCTHYPLLRAPIQAQLGGHVQLIDSGDAVARRLEAVLGDASLRQGDRASGRFYVTGTGPEDTGFVARIRAEGFSEMLLSDHEQEIRSSTGPAL
ncbi:glutamate racemase [Kushneria phyllosphaerae]|uniref:Glutamate racemase n=1 Tax=Kushneria phyllosphaerae TaxID=2100822 RepID=A0A2R8CH28_9GAMM|nr:glutamate racemase [Kushneria phyllosphaerae]SPJ32122.1 Glutamate racemase [Kushneria phyllosphaerae]